MFLVTLKVGFPPQMSLMMDWGMNGSRGPFRSPQRGDIFCLSSAQLCPLDSESLGGSRGGHTSHSRDTMTEIILWEVRAGLNGWREYAGNGITCERLQMQTDTARP